MRRRGGLLHTQSSPSLVGVTLLIETHYWGSSRDFQGKGKTGKGVETSPKSSSVILMDFPFPSGDTGGVA